MGLRFLVTMKQLVEHYTEKCEDDFAAFVTFTNEYNASPIGHEDNDVLDLSEFIRYGTAEPNKSYLLMGNLEKRTVSIIALQEPPTLAKIKEFACLTSMEQFKCLFSDTV